MNKISVIIPVYNVEPYIRKCLGSVISQTYKNLEILIIDDGSSDNSGKICDDYAEKDNRIRVFHKSNGGVSSAKNTGLENMTGQYVGFVDSDDWIEPDMYEALHKAIIDYNVCIGVTSYFKDAGAESEPMMNNKPIPRGVIETVDMALYPLKRDHYMGFCGYMCNKLFRADIFKNADLRFDENIKYGEDVLLYTKYVLSGKCGGIYIDKPMYHYYQRSGAASKSTSPGVKLDILTAYNQIEQLLIDNGYSDMSFWARGFYCYHAGVIARIAAENNDMKILRLMKEEIKKRLDDYIRTNEEFPEKHEKMLNLLKETI